MVLGSNWLLGVLGVAAVGVAALFGARIMAERSQEAHAEAQGWEFVEPATAEMRTIAIQHCSAEAALKSASGAEEQARAQERLAKLERDYTRVSADYNWKVDAQAAAGNRRPWEVPVVAPPLRVSKGRACLKVATAPEPRPGEAVFIDEGNRFLTLEQLDAAALAAGWPMEPGWWPEMRLIIQCETRSLDRFAHNTSDPNGGSFGLAQLNGRQHFDRSGEDFEAWFDPVINLRTALWLRTVRGHFGGSGGWKTCSERHGIE